MRYTVFISVPNVMEVEAMNEEEAKKIVLDNLIATNQIKPATPINISVAQEVKVND